MNHPTVWPGPNFGVQHWLVAMWRRFAFWMWPAATRGAPEKSSLRPVARTEAVVSRAGRG